MKSIADYIERVVDKEAGIVIYMAMNNGRPSIAIIPVKDTKLKGGVKK